MYELTAETKEVKKKRKPTTKEKKEEEKTKMCAILNNIA